MKNIAEITLDLGTLSPAIILGFGLAIRAAQRCQYLEPGESIQDGMPMSFILLPVKRLCNKS
jgi:hypothetical protein